jgi:hypothetical protein
MFSARLDQDFRDRYCRSRKKYFAHYYTSLVIGIVLGLIDGAILNWNTRYADRSFLRQIFYSSYIKISHNRFLSSSSPPPIRCKNNREKEPLITRQPTATITLQLMSLLFCFQNVFVPTSPEFDSRQRTQHSLKLDIWRFFLLIR